MAKVSVLISVEDAHVDRIREVAEDLKTHGLTVERVMPITGTVTGSADTSALTQLERVTGVQAVESSREVGIAPPHSRIQ